MLQRSTTSTLFPYTTLFRSIGPHPAGRGLGEHPLRSLLPADLAGGLLGADLLHEVPEPDARRLPHPTQVGPREQHVIGHAGRDRKSTGLNSSHPSISYAVFC